MEYQILKRLLSQVASIARTQKKMAALTGENFNIFRILKLETREVRTHSAFIGELLNPTGSHGMQATFLRLFVEQIGFPEFDAENAKIWVEKHVGQIDAEYSRGGRIDIYLESKGEFIFIENKIHAADQFNQLERYHEHKQHAKLIYLTLPGSDYSIPAGSSLTREHYQPLSYKNDITSWLSECHQAAASHPIVRETIQQYIHLIKYLTGQTPDNFMKAETKELLSGDFTSFESALHCKQIFEELEGEAIQNFWSELKAVWPKGVDEEICKLQGHSIMLRWYQDDDASEMYYYFYAAPLVEGQLINDELTIIFTSVMSEVNKQFVIDTDTSALTSFEIIKNPNNLGIQERFYITDRTRRKTIIDSMIEQAQSDAAKIKAAIDAL